MGNAHPNIVPYQVFDAADGPLVIACGNDGQFARLCEGLGLALHRDPRLRTNPGRLAHRAEVVAALEARLGGMPRAAVLAAMDAAGVPAGPINSVAEAFAEPQAVARGMVQEIGGSRAPRSPLRFSDAAIAADRPPPAPRRARRRDPRRPRRGATGRSGEAASVRFRAVQVRTLGVSALAFGQPVRNVRAMPIKRSPRSSRRAT